MPLRILNPIRKIVSIASSILGAGGLATILNGGTMTSDPIMDIGILLVITLIIILNGKDGVPDWLRTVAEKRLEKKGGK